MGTRLKAGPSDDVPSSLKGEAMAMPSPATLARLMTWLSPVYPVGGFSYSHGLEWVVEAGGVRDAATLGSAPAQFHLGARYEKGDGVPRDLDRARRYHRLCAAQGVALCQYRLGRLLYSAHARRESEYLQAIAWIQLAAEQNVAEAKTLATEEAPKLTAEQRTWVENLKRQMMRK